ncbi:hypothetical protein TSUD_326050 [Trifolium subterraneum]|uniref:RNase H type-1 domain-containing protein n=1 Tax=Trifolium subterraneum TaxID=3900 RepID=A0A2Z6LLU1_TRISU|nr:hypothetical protein TSUD_326050 [Trifolium subterraneum]
MAANHGSPSLQVAMEEIRSLQKKVTTMEKERVEQDLDSEDESLIESQPLRQSLWDSKVPENFKSPHLPTFDGKTYPVEHLMAVGTQTAIIGAPEHLRCKLLSGTLKDVAMHWYMNLPNNSIESYADFHKKFIHQFSGTKHVKVTATSLFTIRQNYAETLREYLTRFSEATITVSNPNQEMFVAAFHNGLKAGHFNESLAQKPATSMQEVIKRASCYIKGEESNAEKRSRDAKEKDSRNNNSKGQNSQPQRNWQSSDAHKQGYRAKPYHPPNARGGMGYPQYMWHPADRECKGHDTERCFRLRDLIEDLIRRGHLRKFLEDAAKGQIALPKQTPNQQKGEGDGRNNGEKQRVAVNTISGGFAGGGESNSARKRYVRKSRFEVCSVVSSTFPHTPEISFNPEDARDVIPHNDDPLVIPVQILNCGVKRVFIDSGSSADIQYWDAYKAMRLSDEQPNPYSGTLVGFVGEQVDVMGHITLYTTFGEDKNAKTIKVRYLVVNALFTSYNIIIWRSTFNALGAVMCTLYLSIKYPLNNGKVGVVKSYQVLARKCYESSLKIQHRPSKPVSLPVSGERTNRINMVSVTDLDPRKEFQDRRVSPIEDLEQVQIGEQPHQTTSIGTSLQPEERERIIIILRNNRDLFAWQPSDMPGIDESVITHKLSISPINKSVVQRKRKVGEERRAAITEEVVKLKEAGFIEEIKYPTWLANVVMVKKANGKWRIYKTLSFMDAYSGYNQIKMHPMDAQHTTFMSNTCNYFYNVMPFDLKNAGATYQRLKDRVFVEQIGKNLEVYINDMVVKTQKEGEHDKDLDDILKGIEANPDKYQAIINMRSPTSVKEVQQLTGRIAALSRFLSCSGEKACHFFATLRKSERFTWSPELSEKALSSALVQEVEGEEKPIYFVSRTLRGTETRYQKIERLYLAVIITARKLRQYFQSHQVVVKKDYPIKNVLRKPDIAGRMVAWSVELLEFDITYIPRGEIKSQALTDFVLELTDPPNEGKTQPWTISVDGSSNLRGSEVGVVLEGPEGVLIEQSLRFTFKANNNQAEYEALIAGMKLTKDPQLAKYLEKVKGMAKQFTMFELTYVPREQNARADLLAKLTSTKKPGNHRTAIQETYLQVAALPLARDEATKIKKMAAWYTMVGGKLYKRAFSALMLLCVSNTEACRILKEIHEGSCGSHIESRSLAGKRYSNLHHAPGEPLKSVLSPWPFYIWGVDILGPFPLSTAKARWIVVVVDYFTKWVEAEPISGISSDQLGGTPASNIVVISHNATVFDGGTTLHHGLWSKCYDPVEIQPSTWRRDTLTLQENNAALEESLDLLPELWEKAHFREFYTKQRAAKKYNTRVIPRKFKEGDLVLKRPMGRDKGGKMAANWEGPFRIQEAFEGGAYRLETMEGETLPRTWNIANLRFYYS